MQRREKKGCGEEEKGCREEKIGVQSIGNGVRRREKSVLWGHCRFAEYYYRNDKESNTFQRQETFILQRDIDTTVSLIYQWSGPTRGFPL